MLTLLSKATSIWFAIVVLAIANAAVREKILAPQLGSQLALPISGLSLSILILIVAFVTVPLFASSESSTYIFVGLVWGVLTLLFEFLFGHYVGKKSWSELMQVFNLMKGDLFLVALLTTFIAPWLSAKLRGLI